MHAFITGINGFTGKHLAELLRQKGVKVSGVDLKKGGQYYQANLTDKLKIKKILKKEKPDWVFHLASPLIRSDQLIDEALEKNLAVDLFGTVNLIEAVAGLKKPVKILITGTNAEYQLRRRHLALKETDRLEPITSYGLSKMTQELVSRKLADSYGIRLVYTRTFHLIGPGQKEGFVVTDIAKKITLMESALPRRQAGSGQTKKELIIGNLKVKRDFTDVRDAVRAYWLLMKKGKPGEVYNVCSGTSYSLEEIVNQFKQLTPVKFSVKQKSKWRQNDPTVIQGSNNKLRKTTGWHPEISLEQSLKDTLNYWRKLVSA